MNQDRRNGYFPIQALDPTTGLLRECRISFRRWDACKGEEWKAKEVAYTLPEVLRRPLAVFRGVRPDFEGKEDWGFCYVARPSARWILERGGPGRPNTSRSTTPGSELAFLVFVNDDGVVYNWRWESLDPATDAPDESEFRFERQIWPRREDRTNER